MENRRSALEDNLKRYDFYIQNISGKVTYVLTFTTFVMGLTIFKYSDITGQFSNSKILTLVPFILLAIIISAGVAIYFSIETIIPYLKSGNQAGDYHSIIFFNSVSEMSQESYLSKTESLSDPEYEKDLAIQCHTMSKGLKTKYKNIAISLKWLKWGMLLPIAVISVLKIIDSLIVAGQ